MVGEKFCNIVNSESLEISILEKSHFSIGTSPYYAHQNGLAIDIYQTISIQNYDVLSPVSGEVITIKEMRAPKPKFHGGTDKEYLTLIKDSRNESFVYKILHVIPSMREGDHVKIGDKIGRTIRNGYFAYWSSPHIHLEIRPKDDAVRARGGNPFKLLIKKKNEKQNQISENHKPSVSKNLPIIIQKIFPEFILASLPVHLSHNFGHLNGVKGMVGGQSCILDGGIPMYKKGIIVFGETKEASKSRAVYFGSIKIGEIKKIRDRFGLVDFDPVELFLDEIKIRGVSLFLTLKHPPLLKIISFKKNLFSLEVDSTHSLSLRS
jgi:hypothetical protein